MRVNNEAKSICKVSFDAVGAAKTEFYARKALPLHFPLVLAQFHSGLRFFFVTIQLETKKKCTKEQTLRLKHCDEYVCLISLQRQTFENTLK